MAKTAYTLFARCIVGLLISLLALGMYPVPSQAQNNRVPGLPRHRFVPQEVIVKLKIKQPGFEVNHRLESVDQILKQYRFRDRIKQRVEERGVDRIYKATIQAGSDVSTVLRSLRSDPDVEYAEPNFIYEASLIPNDPGLTNLWGMQNTGQSGGTPGADIDAPLAWDITHDATLVVGVIDTGIDYNHQDLKNNMWTNIPEANGSAGVDDDGNGFVDDIYGYDFVGNDGDPFDDYGHGTHVAGTIGAVGNNTVGVVGVNWNAKIAAIKFLGSGGFGTTEGAVKAVQYANLMGFPITNNSWGGGGYSQALYDAISAASGNGFLFIAAAGNSGLNTDASPSYPASYNLDNIISVAATDHNDQKASFSNYGVTSVDVGAPGVNVYSTVPTSSCSLCDPSGYKYLSGTSMASPHVSGAAALLWSKNPTLSHQQVKQKIMGSSDPTPSLQGKTVSGGRLNINNFFEIDTTAPAAITDLSTLGIGHSAVTLQWSAVGDDGNTGKATSYDIRSSTSPLDEANFSAATPAQNPPAPLPAGTNQSFKVTGLSPDTTYYFAMKAIDNMNNASAISNVVSEKTEVATVIFSDTMEAGSSNWTASGTDGAGGPSLWHVSQRRSVSPTSSWYYGKESTGNYNTGNTHSGSITSSEIQLTNVTGSELVFEHFLSTENFSPYDVGSVQVSKDTGASWTTVLSKTTSNGSFIKERVDLSSFDGTKIKLRFSFDTKDSILNNFEGWYMDNVSVLGVSSGEINTPPIAQAGDDKTAFTNQTVQFDGSGSTDPDGTIASYAWDFGDGASSSGKLASHVYTTAGSYTVTLTVVDNGGLPDTDTALVTVTNSPISVFTDSFEVSEWNGLWTEDNQNDWFRSRQRKTNGRYAAEVDGSALDAQLISKNIDLQGRTSATISFSWFIESGLDLGEYVAFDVSIDNGATWTEKARMRGDVDQENIWKLVTIDLVNINTLKIRFRGKMSSSTEDADVDMVSVVAK